MTAWGRAGRPKPPLLNTLPMYHYVHTHNTIFVRYSRYFEKWDVWTRDGFVGDFPTHAEAITYAGKIANERSTRYTQVRALSTHVTLENWRTYGG